MSYTRFVIEKTKFDIMKKAKSTLKVLLILVLGLTVNLSMAQTETEDVKVKKKEKKITISKIKVVNGEKVKWDTTIVMTAENKEEVKKYLQEHANAASKINIKLEMLDDDMKKKLVKLKEYEVQLHEMEEHLEGEEGLKKHIEVIVKMNDDMLKKAEWHAEHSDELQKTIKLALESIEGELHLYELKEGHKEKLHEVMEIHKHKLLKLKKLHKGGKGLVFVTENGDSTDIDLDFDFDVKGLHDIMVDVDVEKEGDNTIIYITKDGKRKKIEHFKKGNVMFFGDSTDIDFEMDKNFVVEIAGDHDKNFLWVGEDGKHKNNVKRMKFVSKGDKEGNIMFFSDDAHADFTFDMNIDTELNEEDFALLKKAGIKVKTNELAVDKLRLTYEDDSFGLIFKIKTEGKASIKVVDSAGELVFSDKVQYFPGTYHKSLGLNSDNAGTYFIYVEQGRASFTTKVNLN